MVNLCGHRITGLSCRYTIAVLIHIGLIVTSGMRTNVGIAILDIKKQFNWSPLAVSLIVGAHPLGYLSTLIIGGYLATRVPTNRLFGICSLISTCVNILIPVSCHIHFSLVLVARVMQGLAEGLAFPACYGIWTHWAPPLEKSRLVTIATSGQSVAFILGMPLSGILTKYFGWTSSFYFYGGFGMVWYILWHALVYECPGVHPRINEDELIYIRNSMDENSNTKETKRTPWKKIFTSLPFYALIWCNFIYVWNNVFLVFGQPKFYNDVFGFETFKTGIYSMIPILAMALMMVVGGCLADLLLKSQLFTTTVVRKIFTCGGFGIEGILLFITGYLHNQTYILVLLTIVSACCGISVAGFNVNFLELAPQYSSLLKGIATAIGNSAGIVFPIIMEQLTENETRSEWRTIFIIASMVHFGGLFVYGMFASGERQSWANSQHEEVDEQ